MTVELEHMRVVANGLSMNVVAAGPRDAPAMVLLHGFPEGWMSWRHVMTRLADRFRVVAPDLRGYGGTEKPNHGYDVVTLTDDIHALIGELGLQRPTLVGHDWGGALAWIYGHRYGPVLKRLVVVNCTHPRTLLRGVVRGTDGQTLRSTYAIFFQLPAVPEWLLSLGGAALIKATMLRMEGSPGAMDRALVNELAARFSKPEDLRAPLAYYRAFVRSHLSTTERSVMRFVYASPIACPVTVLWGDRDLALSEEVARMSAEDAHTEVDFRVLPGVGHFVSLEVPDLLADELAALATEEPSDVPPDEDAGEHHEVSG